jgi:multidrug efflux pump subunit AcrA (membrane-fusion protein)
MIRKIGKMGIYVALVLAGIAVGILLRGQLGTWVHGDSGTTPGTSTSTSERKVLYWYDAMNPLNRYNKPGKAPDGIDLVPKYAEEGGENMPGMDMAQPQTASKSTPQGERKVLFYYDAMNPQNHYNKQGKAPDGMELVPRYAEEPGLQNIPVGTVRISQAKQQLIGVETSVVRREKLFRTIRAVGQLTADETKLAHVHLKVSGWIDEVYVDYVGKLVKKGEPLFTLYSPDLVSTEQEYLIARKGKQYLGNSTFPDASQGADSLLQSARERLRLWDISDEQIKKLDETGEVTRTLTFYSPIDGFVLDRKAFPQTNATPDMELYTMADLSTIWATAEIYEFEVPYVSVGQQAQMQLSYFPGKTYSGRVTYVYPTVDPQTRTVKVRLEFPNPNFELKPQMYSDVMLNIDYGTQVVVPQAAVLDSGERQTVFVALGDGYFAPREINTGAKVDEKVIVLAGLKAGETIVTSGNFLIDSESRLSSAMGGMKH